MNKIEGKKRKTEIILQINDLIDEHHRKDDEKQPQLFGKKGIRTDCACDICVDITVLGKKLSETLTNVAEEGTQGYRSYQYTVYKNDIEVNVVNSLTEVESIVNVKSRNLSTYLSDSKDGLILVGSYKVVRKETDRPESLRAKNIALEGDR